MILKYIKDRIGYIIIILLFSFIFGTLSFLYGLHFDGILYGIIVCVVICLIIGIIDFLRYKKKHIQLTLVSKSIKSGDLLLPEPKNLQENDYQTIIDLLNKEFTNAVTKSNLLRKELNDFYALWAHQIKTPISAMSLLIQENNSKNQKALASELFKIERYTELVLNFLKIEDISSDLSFSSYNLEDIVKQAVKKFAPIFIAKNISISLENLQVSVLTDEKWLEFAIEQIISNALKYTKENGRINIYCEDLLTLVIKDNGIGIAYEDLPRIFEKGFTGYNGRMDKKATGIGLYLTKKTLDKLGHKIEIFSANFMGTTVKIDLYREKMTIE
ncbi:MAG: sensor histidine kinase [Oscillospiraceae bacterium]